MNKTINLTYKKQQGAILIVALIMLLLLTIIGLSSMRGTSLQENMTGNMRDSNLSLQAAEAALRKGEQIVKSESPSALDTLELTPQAGTYASFPGVGADPSYTITHLARQRTSTSTSAGEPVSGFAIVRVEATGYGASTNSDNSASSITILRSTFQTPEY